MPRLLAVHYADSFIAMPVLAAVTLVVTLVVTPAACGSDGPNGPAGSHGPSPSTRAPANAVTCGTATAVFSQSPVAIADIVGWVPLGNMEPPGHTMPTDHQYIYVNNPESQAPRREVNVYAPANLIITKAHLGTTTPGGTDYTVEFSPCAEVYAQFGHVRTIVPAILTQLGSFDQFCNTYSPSPGSSVATCETKSVAVVVHAGDLIGTVGGPDAESFALDVSLWDARIPSLVYANPTRWPMSNDKFDAYHVAPASDYFTEPANTQIAPHVGSFDGTTRRTVLPIGGTHAVDVIGTMMGFWFNDSQPVSPETPHLAFAPDNVDPTHVTLSSGTSLPGWDRGRVTFTPVDSGLVNRSPAQLTPDGRIYCFEGLGSWVVLAQMIDASTLRVEYEQQRAFSCANAQPWAFTAAKFDYKR